MDKSVLIVLALMWIMISCHQASYLTNQQRKEIADQIWIGVANQMILDNYGSFMNDDDKKILKNEYKGFI